MKLSEYLSTHNIKRDEFARRIGVTEVAITRYINGTRAPRRSVMQAILAETGGSVAPNDFLEPGPTSPFPTTIEADA